MHPTMVYLYVLDYLKYLELGMAVFCLFVFDFNFENNLEFSYTISGKFRTMQRFI